MADLMQRPDLTFVLADEPIYVGKVAGGDKDHAVGTLHHSTSVHVDHYGDHWITHLSDGQTVQFDCGGQAFSAPCSYDCNDVLTWRLFDYVPQVVNLIGHVLTPGDIDYGDQVIYREDATSTDPKAARRSYGGRSNNMGTFHSAPQVQPKPITFIANRVKPLWSITFGCSVGYKFYPADQKDEMASFKVDAMPDARFGIPRPFISELDKIDGRWQITYKKVNGHCELIEIKECGMSDQPEAKTTDSLNEAIGRHWAENPDDEKKYRTLLKKKIVFAKLMTLYDIGKGKAMEAVIQGQWIPAMVNAPQDSSLKASPFDSWNTAEANADKWIATMVAGSPKNAKPDVPEHEHVFEGPRCKVCDIHWSKVEKIRAGLHVWIDELFANRNADEKTHDAQYEFVKECNGIKHLEDSDLSLEGFKAEAEGTVDAMYPKTNTSEYLAKDLMTKWLAEFKTIRTDVNDKNEAIKLVAGLFSDDVNVGLHTVVGMVGNIGVDGAQKQWDELKHMLKPAAPKGTNGTHPPADKPAEKPQQQVQTKPKPEQPVQQTTAVATVPQNIVTINSPELAALEAKKQEALILIKSGLLPKAVDTPEKVIVIGMMGEALGIEKIVALNNINVIAGKPTVSPQLMLALVRRSKKLETFSATDDGNTCTVRMKRTGEDEHVETFSMDDARRMTTTEWDNNNKRTIPLADKKNWKEQPATMRKWRALAAACRVVFPDVIWGLYTPDEMGEDASDNTVDAEFVEQVA